MLSATLDKKASKQFSSESRKFRRVSTQVSPTSRSNIPYSKDDTASPRPISSNDATQTCKGTLQAQQVVGEPQGHSAQVLGAYTTLEIAAKESVQSSFRPPRLLDMVGGSKQASLLGLPVEIRLIIYKYVFPPSKPGGAAETLLYCASTLQVLGPPLHSQLCRVNRQIYGETRGLLYGQTLVFLSREALINFSATRTPKQLSQLRSICMKPRITDWVGAIKTLDLPPFASLSVHWPIKRNLWEAILANNTLNYRAVSLKSGREGQLVILEPFRAEDQDAKMPSYEYLQKAFGPVSE